MRTGPRRVRGLLRRQAVAGTGALAALAALACGSSPESGLDQGTHVDSFGAGSSAEGDPAGSGGGLGEGAPRAGGGAGERGDVSPAPGGSEPSAAGRGSSAEQGTGSAAPCGRLAEGLAPVLERLDADLASVPEESQPFTRYLVVSGEPRYACGLAEEDEAVRTGARERYAAVLALNSLSREPALAALTPVEGAQAWLLRLDLRGFGWQREVDVAGQSHADGWSAVSARALLALRFSGAAAEQRSARMGTEVPFLLASDFVTAALSRELYYPLLDAPETLPELRQRLGIAPEETLNTPSWARAGFSTSGISKQDRGIARYVGGSGSDLVYWETMDFEPDSQFPVPVVSPLSDRADVHTAIYALPNGLSAYFVADAEGRRLVEVPASVDIDPAQSQGISYVGASCFSCHAGGFIPFTDIVRPTVEATGGAFLSPEELGIVLATYPEVAEFNRVVERDSEAFLRARGRLGIPRGAPGPVTRVALAFERSTPAGVAGELFLHPQSMQARAGELPEPVRLAAQGLGGRRRGYSEAYLAAVCRLNAGQVELSGCP